MPQLIIEIIEYLGIIAFSVSGAMIAIDKETDLFGVVFLAIITSFGGGITRDLLIGNIMPVFFESYVKVAVAVASAVIVYIVAAVFKKGYVNNEALISKINNYFDAAGLGVFTVAGVKLCLDFGIESPFAAIVMGMITGVGGGMIRDFSLKEIPFVLRKRIYAVASLAGGTLYYLLYKFGVAEIVALIVGICFIFAIRVLATVFKLNMPKAIIFSELTGDEKNGEESKG